MRKQFLLATLLLVSLSAMAWKPIFVGHRGSLRGVSNTEEAYRNGVDFYHYQALECDVRVTSDNQYVIMHDETTKSLGGNLTVATSTLAQLKAETLTQTRDQVTYTGQICTVAEYLDICNEKNVFPVIELKWTTGINNNDMSKFAGLMQLVQSKGLADKAVFLTSMKSSLEYIRTNYPTAKCQFLGNSNWSTNFEWCVNWRINPSIEAGSTGFDYAMVKRFHDAGLQVAVWTVNSAANYKKYGEIGVYMMTCDYLRPNDMDDLTDIDWSVQPIDDSPLKITVDTLFRKCGATGTLPTNFPLGGTGTYMSAQQAFYLDGVFYTTNYSTSKLLKIAESGTITAETGTNSHGIAKDDAGNMIVRNDGITANPSALRLYKKGTTTPVDLNFTLTKAGQTNFIFASGDVFSETGGYVYFFPNNQKYVTALKIVNGAIAEQIISNELSIAGSTAGMVYPIGNDPTSFVYQVRANGYYLYKNGVDKGAYLTGSTSTTNLDLRNSSLGGAFFRLGGHDLLVHQSGTNYNGGITLKDMTAKSATLAKFPALGSAGYSGNPSCGSFVTVKPVNEYCVELYQYCQGNGIAAYRISLQNTQTDLKSKTAGKTVVYPTITDNFLNINSIEPIETVKIYSLTGVEMLSLRGSFGDKTEVNLSNLPAGIYLVKVNNQSAQKVVKK